MSQSVRESSLNQDLDFILEKCQDLLSELKNKSIFITGATGFFGKWLLHTLIHFNDSQNTNIKILALSRNPDKFLTESPFFKGKVHFFIGDIRTFELDERADYVIHAATDANIAAHRDNPEESFDVIVEGTKHLLKELEGKGIKSFLNISSGAIYGRQPAEVTHISETFGGAPDPLVAGNSYGVAKRSAELLVNIYGEKYQMKTVHARCFAFAGAYLPLDASFAIGNFVADVINGREIKLTGDGSPLRSYMYAADLMIWLMHLMLRGKDREAYNVGSDQAVSVKALAEAVKAEGDYEFKEKYESSNQYIPSVEKAKLELGLSLNFDLNTIIKKMLEWNVKGQYRQI